MDEHTLVLAVRIAARCSGTLLLAVFAASGLSRLGALGRWLDDHSAGLFLAFTAAHLVHLAALVTWASLFPASFFANRPLAPVVVGAGLYVFIAIIAVRAIRCLPNGHLQVTRVETIGLYLLWTTFTASFASRAGESRLHVLLTVAALGALAARFVPRRASEPGRLATTGSSQPSGSWS